MSRLYTQERLECEEEWELYQIFLDIRRRHQAWGYQTPRGVSVGHPGDDREDIISSILWHQEELQIKIRRCLDKAINPQSVL